jgi:ornithine carbamoyltransferase
VVYAKSWTSPLHYGNNEAEADFRSGLRDWCVRENWFAPAAADCRFMHCLPVRRNVVVADEVLDGPRSVVVAEARNRMWAQMAVLYRLLQGKKERER